MDTQDTFDGTYFEAEGWDINPEREDGTGQAAFYNGNLTDRWAIILLTFIAGAFIAGIVLWISSSVSFSHVIDQPPLLSGEGIAQEPGAAASDQGLEPPDALLDRLPPGVDCQVSEGFPSKVRRWCGIITAYSDKRGLPPDLVAAVILQESGGNPSAFSHSGAVGLMQVMPRDGPASSFMCANGPCFASRPRQDELLDPEFNIAYGTRMLSGLVRKHGSLREALKSYGPMDGGYSYADKVLGIYKRFGS